MRNTKLFVVLLIVMGSILFTGCVTGKRNSCLHPKKKVTCKCSWGCWHGRGTLGKEQ